MTAPQELAPGVYRVDAFRFSNFINVLLLENDDGWTLVDTGVDSSAGRIEEALASLGAGPGTSSASSSPTSTTTTQAV